NRFGGHGRWVCAALPQAPELGLGVAQLLVQLCVLTVEIEALVQGLEQAAAYPQEQVLQIRMTSVLGDLVGVPQLVENAHQMKILDVLGHCSVGLIPGSSPPVSFPFTIHKQSAFPSGGGRRAPRAQGGGGRSSCDPSGGAPRGRAQCAGVSRKARVQPGSRESVPLTAIWPLVLMPTACCRSRSPAGALAGSIRVFRSYMWPFW